MKEFKDFTDADWTMFWLQQRTDAKRIARLQRRAAK